MAASLPLNMGSRFTTDTLRRDLSLLQDPLSAAPFRGKMDAESPHRLLRGELQPLRAVQVTRAMGGKLTDLIWTTWAGVFLISGRVRELMQHNKVSGWTTYAVQVFDADGTEIEGYHGFAVTGRCGPFDPDRSELVTKPPPTPQGRPALFRRGLVFDLDTWDGSDVFCPSIEGYKHVICVDRVRKLLAREKVTNVRWERLSEYEVLVKTL